MRLGVTMASLSLRLMACWIVYLSLNVLTADAVRTRRTFEFPITLEERAANLRHTAIKFLHHITEDRHLHRSKHKHGIWGKDFDPELLRKHSKEIWQGIWLGVMINMLLFSMVLFVFMLIWLKHKIFSGRKRVKHIPSLLVQQQQRLEASSRAMQEPVRQAAAAAAPPLSEKVPRQAVHSSVPIPASTPVEDVSLQEVAAGISQEALQHTGEPVAAAAVVGSTSPPVPGKPSSIYVFDD